MNSSRAMEIVELAANLMGCKGNTEHLGVVAAFPARAASDAWKIASLASRLHRYAELDCNQGLDEKQEKSAERIEKQIRDMVLPYAITQVEFNGDPRGYAVYLKLPSGRTNDWGKRGWGI